MYLLVGSCVDAVVSCVKRSNVPLSALIMDTRVPEFLPLPDDQNINFTALLSLGGEVTCVAVVAQIYGMSMRKCASASAQGWRVWLFCKTENGISLHSLALEGRCQIAYR